ncbi:hypothetical protein HJC23_014014 [Cyclotella cryptica]|uniref:Calmodulin n=1 Tax=Cyclotella cryptica TaxID=29204 RepID=A0ABD3NDV0_9STRA|eukprot:CCRYP_021216-RA/>CCRYP_021216-RA protein AED:0.05 eAED:0.05 QI:349/1/1/1/0.71/0.5/8/1442/824
MGNSSSKSAKIDEIVSILADNTSERETSSTWYRYGVEITDVYDVIEVLGQGHMGEVFTVRRKTTGHHTEETKEGIKREQMEAEEKAKGAHNRKNSFGGVQFSKKKTDKSVTRSMGTDTMKLEEKGKHSHVRKTSFAHIPFSRQKSDGSSPSSPGAKNNQSKEKETKSPKVKDAVRKVSDRTTKVLKKIGGGDGDTVEADARLGEYLLRSDTAESHEPPAHDAKPKKGIIKSDSDSKHSHSPSNTEIDVVGNVGSDMSKLSLERVISIESVNGNADSAKAKRGVHFQRTFAVKTILTSRVNKEQVQEMVNEIMIMRKLDHPYVLKLYEVYHVKRKIWLVTELCTGGDLSTRKLNEHSAKNVIEQILRALVYLHRLGIVHRDLKLENVLYENNSKDASIRLIDFGLSRTFDRTCVLNDYSRTPYTMTPEVAAGNAKSAITDKADVWAVGIIAWVLLSGEFPFVKTSADLKDKDKMETLKKAKFHFGVTWKGRGISSQAKEFVTGCLQQDPGKRWTSKQALENLQKSWGPEVDKIWDAWQAEIKKLKEPEFVRADSLRDDDDETRANEEESSTPAALVGSAEAPKNDDDDVPLSKNDAKARAERIKKHVTKVVKQKKKEVDSGVSGDDGIDMMEEIERYTQFGFLKKKILITMANTMDRSEVSELREWFLNADTNDSGTITLQELKDALKKVTPDADDSKIEVLFRGVDRDQSGHIHYAEFLAALSESHGLVTMDRLTEAFDRIDKEGKGYITHEDLKEMLGSDYDKETVDKMIEEGDFKKNNQIDYEELLQVMFSDPARGDKIVGHVTPETIARHSSILDQDSLHV